MIGAILNNKYEIRSSVFESHQYMIFEALEMETGAIVIVKVLKEEMCVSSDRVKVFGEEVKSFASLTHPNIVHVLDLDMYDNCPYVVTEKVDGVSLRDGLHEGSYSFAQVAKIIQQLAMVLHYAADQGVSHRSIKLSNILKTSEGKIKILSFTHPRLKLIGSRKTAPEAGCQSDLFFLGSTMFELLRGESPIRKRGGLNELWSGQLMQTLRIKHSHLTPEQVDSIVEFLGRTFTRNIQERFQGHEEFLVGLTNLIFKCRVVANEKQKPSRAKLSSASEVVDAINGRVAAVSSSASCSQTKLQATGTTGSIVGTVSTGSSQPIAQTVSEMHAQKVKTAELSQAITSGSSRLKLLKTPHAAEAPWRISDEPHWLRNPILLTGSLLTFMLALIFFW